MTEFVVQQEVWQIVASVEQWTAQVSSSGPQGPAGLLMQTFSQAGTLAVTTGVSRFYVERAGTLTTLRASVSSPSTGSGVAVALRKNGTTVATVTIPAGSNTATSSPAVALVTGDYLTIDITAVGSTTAGANLTATVTIN